MIGETPREFEPRQPDDATQLGGVYIDGVFMTWIGKRYRHSGWFYNGHAMTDSFSRSDGQPLTADDFNRFLKAYSTWTFGELYTAAKRDYALAYQNGRVVGAMFLYKETHVLEFVNAFVLARMEQQASQPTPPPQPQPQPRITSDDTDCKIVASEMYARLKNMPWRNIVGFHFVYDGIEQGGHAMCVWQIVPNGAVQAYDKMLGSVALRTTSTALDDVIKELANMFSTFANKQVTLVRAKFEADQPAATSAEVGTKERK
jgi:hypothetical protein